MMAYIWKLGLRDVLSSGLTVGRRGLGSNLVLQTNMGQFEDLDCRGT